MPSNHRGGKSKGKAPRSASLALTSFFFPLSLSLTQGSINSHINVSEGEADFENVCHGGENHQPPQPTVGKSNAVPSPLTYIVYKKKPKRPLSGQPPNNFFFQVKVLAMVSKSIRAGADDFVER